MNHCKTFHFYIRKLTSKITIGCLKILPMDSTTQVDLPPHIFTARKRSLRRLCFYRCLSVHTGGGVRGFIQGGHAWFYSGGVRGFIWGGHVWFYLGGMRGFIGGHAWFYFGGHAWFFPVFSDTMRYGQWAGGTHPTGMHSCLCNKIERFTVHVNHWGCLNNLWLFLFFFLLSLTLCTTARFGRVTVALPSGGKRIRYESYTEPWK